MKTHVAAAVVMAAGRGKRLRPLTDGIPKAMVEVAGRPLLARHVDVLRAYGVGHVVVVVGWRKEAVRELLGREEDVRLVENPIHETSGSGHSLALGLRALGASEVEGDVAFMDADLLYAPGLFQPLLGPPSDGNALLVGKGREDDAEAVKVRGRTGLVRELRKTAPSESGLEFLGESVGIARLDPDGRTQLLGWMAVREQKSGPDYEWEHAIEANARDLELRAVQAPDLPWTEVDTAEDLERARRIAEEL